MSANLTGFRMTIGGALAPTERSFGVIDPATGAVFAEAPDCTPAQLDAAVAAAKGALPSWSRDEAARRAALEACGDAIEANVEALAGTLTLEQGKPLVKARGECMGAAHWFREFARMEIPHDVLRDDESARVEVCRRPLGVVGSIAPWNFPVFLAGIKTAPALLMGNTVVLKPSPFTPLATLELGKILQDVLPPGVFNVVSGGDDLGAAITRHRDVRMICFTGSVATGKKVAAAAAPDLKRFVLELGGNDPAIVLEDADPVAIAEKLFWSAFSNAGQVCIATKRVYVHESVYPRLVEAMAEIATRVRVGPGIEPESQLGPLNNAPQFERVDELVEDAKRAGAKVLTGGAPLDRPGYFYPPTIVTGIADGVRLVDEEQFGPALPVMPFRDVEEALERANATHFGLMGSVWTQDLERGAEVAARLEVGKAGVNKHGGIDPMVPFGGAKWSGVGYQFGRWGLETYASLQVVELDRT
ncbi:MAG: aldehyde dehydrogenase family protein [Trueperaceae bacterium]